MATRRVAGTAKIETGRLKKEIGKITGNDTLKAQGQAQIERGRVQRVFGRVKDVLTGRW